MAKPLVGKRKRGHVVRREKAREPQLVERSKRVLLVRGTKAGPFGLDFLRDLKKIKGADEAVLFSRKNEIRPFEDETSIESLCQKSDAGLFAVCNHSKKRPNNLCLGRLYDGHLLDLVECSIDNFVSLEEMVEKHSLAKAMGSQSCVLFQGDSFDKNPNMQTMRSLLLDLFKCPVFEQVDLTALDHLVVCTAIDEKIYIRNYVIVFKGKSQESSSKGTSTSKVASLSVMGAKIPDIGLVDMGPSLDLSIRRVKLASTDLMKLAMRQPKSTSTPTKVKNVTHDEIQGKMGRIHMKKQDTSKLVTRSRFKKALKRGQDE